MAKIVLKGFRPISINRAYYRNRKLTEEARRIRASILCQLQSQLNKLHDIKSQFDPKKHYLTISYTLYYPIDQFFTKSRQISNRSQDVDNCLKLITDCICSTKYNTDWLKSRTKRYKHLYSSITTLDNLAIDDRFIADLSALKRPTKGDYRVEVEIGLKPLSELNSMCE